MTNNLEKSIVKTIAYYNELDFPLTVFEIWKYLIINEGEKSDMAEPCNLLDIINVLNSDALNNYLEEFEGFYFLRGRKDLIEKRLKKNKIADSKMRRLRKFVSILRLVPFIRMVGVTGTLAMKNSGTESDWDLLIVLKSGRIWIGRTFVTGLIHFLGKRRHDNKIKNRICLNYFLTDESLEIRSKDLFSANEYSFMLPAFDSGRVFKKFQLANRWITNFKPNYSLEEINNIAVVHDSWFSKFFRKVGEIIFDLDWLENKFRIWEQDKIKNNTKTKQEGSYIEATDRSLIFLPDPQGPKVFENYKKQVEKLNIL